MPVFWLLAHLLRATRRCFFARLWDQLGSSAGSVSAFAVEGGKPTPHSTGQQSTPTLSQPQDA
jgi:hypothetical protein